MPDPTRRHFLKLAAGLAAGAALAPVAAAAPAPLACVPAASPTLCCTGPYDAATPVRAFLTLAGSGEQVELFWSPEHKGWAGTFASGEPVVWRPFGPLQYPARDA